MYPLAQNAGLRQVKVMIGGAPSPSNMRIQLERMGSPQTQPQQLRQSLIREKLDGST
jgi:hypothetical protein